MGVPGELRTKRSLISAVIAAKYVAGSGRAPAGAPIVGWVGWPRPRERKAAHPLRGTRDHRQEAFGHTLGRWATRAEIARHGDLV